MTFIAPAGFCALPLSVTQLSLAAVLQCGQSFRWNIFPLASPPESSGDQATPTHEYRLCLRDRVVCLRQSPNSLFYRSAFAAPPCPPCTEDEREAETLAWLRDYFQLDVDLVELYQRWGERDPVFRNCQERFSGIRMLRQDPFENLISFICSSNNNINRITKMVKALCQHYSPVLVTLPVPSDGIAIDSHTEAYYPFPPPSALAAADVSSTLRTLGFGYRAEFIQKTAKMLVDSHGTERSDQDVLEPAEKWLRTLRQMSTSEAREELLKFMGVGRKVADCILLMSLDKNEVIPVDTHVHQIAAKHYGVSTASKTKSGMTPKLYNEVSSKLAAVWGEYAGWAHSVLFTSDLKSFSSYGLPTPSPSPISETSKARNSPSQPILNTAPETPSLLQTSKRKRGTTKTSVTIAVEEHKDDALMTLPVLDDTMDLADRVKRRRRARTVERVV